MQKIPSGPIRIAALTAALVVSACSDAPTVPEAVQQIAGGEAWVAVPPPVGLPDLATWTPYLPEDGSARARVGSLEERARRAMLDGDLEHAAHLEQEAVRVAVLSLPASPDPAVITAALEAIDGWTVRVNEGIDPRVYPEVAASLLDVRRARGLAAVALERGDTAGAVLRISEAAAAIGTHTPAAVALRVLGRAEARLRAASPGPAVLERTIHLIRSARLELVDGDPSRALRRALYALQLAEGA